MCLKKRCSCSPSDYMRECYAGGKLSEAARIGALKPCDDYHTSYCHLCDVDTFTPPFFYYVYSLLVDACCIVYFAMAHIVMSVFAKYVGVSKYTVRRGGRIVSEANRFMAALLRTSSDLQYVVGFKKRQDRQKRRSAWMMQLLRPIKLSHGIRCCPVSVFIPQANV
jgi:hypothetical protein